MTPQKAILLLTRDKDNLSSVDMKDLAEAEELGIQALKRELEYRRLSPKREWNLLPGETE